MDKNIECPEGYIIRKPSIKRYYWQAFFQWDRYKKSDKIKLLNEDLTFKALDGSGFKSVLGTFVRGSVVWLLNLTKPFTPGYKYYYEVSLDKGSLIKIGVSLKEVNLEEVTFTLSLNFRKGFFRY